MKQTGWRRAVAGVATLAALVGAGPLLAQGPPAPADSVYRRAQRLVIDGDTARGRALIDSLVRTTPDRSDARATALFWRATLAPDSVAAQRDYLTIAIDYPLSPPAADALLRVGQADFAWGDRAASLRHLERLVLEYPTSDAAVDGWILLGRARIGGRDLASGCVALDSARGRLKAGDVERGSQIAFAMQSCRQLGVTPAAPAPAAGTGAKPPGGAATRPAPEPSTARRWSVQVAAYKVRADADKLAKTLTERGYDARVDALNLYHVRIGLFRTRAEAATIVANLKQRQITAIIVEVTRRAP